MTSIAIQLPLGTFKAKYGKLQGRDWITRIDPEDKDVFVRVGQSHAEYGRLGGQANARTCNRGDDGRFARK